MNTLHDVQLLDELKQHLLDEKQRLSDLLTKTQRHLRRTEPLSADFAEQAIETENDQVVEALDQEAQIELSQINKALLRMEEGQYGDCVVCGNPIGSQRLEAIPHTPFCYACASAK
ncbi:TraR/DksA family transcriptional regulator [Marinicella sediminis]|uniref:TraR/DksA family transcriptional regulator n=1 Tax=Marinicella sediminis TaxID=1792834 RepID=A0ABV7JAT1_9GAMM|nr:TraR/DksA family transcriptional regulator [Marinicella sediminis]